MSKRLPPPQHEAEYVPELHPAAGPWQSPCDSDPDKADIYLVQYESKTGARLINVLAFTGLGEWLLPDNAERVLRYAEIYPA